jgi:Na+/proline symporter
MRAVIWTDVIQFVLYILGSLGAFFLLLHKIPGGWPEITQVAAAAGGKLRIFDFAFSLTKSYTFWSGLIGGTFLTMASHGVDQTMVQRLLSARNERDAKKALVVSGVIVFFQFTLFLLIGVMLFVYGIHETLVEPDGDPDRIYPWFIVHRMPIVAVGLLLASIFAIAMSNASGSLNSLASSSIIDLGRRRTVGTDAAADARSLGRSRVTTLFWGVVLGALGLVNWGPVLVAGLTIAAITYGAMLGVFLLGMWNKRANETGALTGFVVALVSMIVVRYNTSLAFTWYVLVGSVITFAIGSLVSSFAGAQSYAKS